MRASCSLLKLEAIPPSLSVLVRPHLAFTVSSVFRAPQRRQNPRARSLGGRKLQVSFAYVAGFLLEKCTNSLCTVSCRVPRSDSHPPPPHPVYGTLKMAVYIQDAPVTAGQRVEDALADAAGGVLKGL